MKKLLSLVLAACLLLALAACGKPYTPIPNPPLVMGEKYLTDLDYEQAILQFDQAIQIDPKNPRGYLGKADALLNLDRQDEAAEILGAAVKSVPKEQREPMRVAQAEAESEPVDGFIGLAGAYERLGWADIALSLVKRAVQKFPRVQKLLDEWLRLSADLNDASQFEGRVYQVFDEGMTWYEAKARCESLGGHLATITSQAEQDFIEGLILSQSKNVYWLGGTNVIYDGQWGWISDEAFVYTCWADGEPNNKNGNEHYLQVFRVPYPTDVNTTGKWNDLAYNGLADDSFYTADNMGFICEWESGYEGDVKTMPSDTVSYEDSLYRVFDTSMTWYEAKAFCETRGGHLATITSQAEQEFIQGLIGNAGSTMFWIGLIEEDGSWGWITGESYDYTNWNPGEPSGWQYHGVMLGHGEFFQYGAWLDNPNEGVPDTIWSLQTTGFICEWSAAANLE